VAFKQTVIDKLTHEMAVLKRLKFAANSKRFSPEQKSLLKDAIDEDLEALAREVERVVPPAKDSREKRQPKRHALPARLPRREVHHEPQTTTYSCGCALKRIGEDVAEKLDYTPGTRRKFHELWANHSQGHGLQPPSRVAALLLDPRQHCLTEHLRRVKMTWPDAYPKTTTSGRTNQRLL
jgi:hypothetical protein